MCVCVCLCVCVCVCVVYKLCMAIHKIILSHNQGINLDEYKQVMYFDALHSVYSDRLFLHVVKENFFFSVWVFFREYHDSQDIRQSGRLYYYILYTTSFTDT